MIAAFARAHPAILSLILVAVMVLLGVATERWVFPIREEEPSQ